MTVQLPLTGQRLKSAGMHGNAVPRPVISAIWHIQTSKSAYFRGNARSQAGKNLNRNVFDILSPICWQECEGY